MFWPEWLWWQPCLDVRRAYSCTRVDFALFGNILQRDNTYGYRYGRINLRSVHELPPILHHLSLVDLGLLEYAGSPCPASAAVLGSVHHVGSLLWQRDRSSQRQARCSASYHRVASFGGHTALSVRAERRLQLTAAAAAAAQ